MNAATETTLQNHLKTKYHMIKVHEEIICQYYHAKRITDQDLNGALMASATRTQKKTLKVER